jgi:long-chain acyl-CoA synthetase
MGSFWIEGTIGAIKALAFVCDILTYPVYLILQRPWEKKAMSRRIKVSTLLVVVQYVTPKLSCVIGCSANHVKILNCCDI